MNLKKIFHLILFLLASFFSVSTVADEKTLVEQMKSGNAALMIRHALAPGIGDPEEFELGDCNTQRNLNDTGRDQARAIGNWLRSRGIEKAKIYSSQWCRCMETAQLMQMGKVTPMPALNSFFEQTENREPSLIALRAFIRDNSKPGELIIMVTHQVTISGITNKWTDSGYGKLVRPNATGGIELLGEVSFQ
jgi:phosphohistidine phosphatase SixA